MALRVHSTKDAFFSDATVSMVTQSPEFKIVESVLHYKIMVVFQDAQYLWVNLSWFNN